MSILIAPFGASYKPEFENQNGSGTGTTCRIDFDFITKERTRLIANLLPFGVAGDISMTLAFRDNTSTFGMSGAGFRSTGAAVSAIGASASAIALTIYRHNAWGTLGRGHYLELDIFNTDYARDVDYRYFELTLYSILSSAGTGTSVSKFNGLINLGASPTDPNVLLTFAAGTTTDNQTLFSAFYSSIEEKQA